MAMSSRRCHRSMLRARVRVAHAGLVLSLTASAARAFTPVYCGPEMASLQRLSPKAPVLVLSSLATSANGFIVIASTSSDGWTAARIGGLAISQIGAVSGLLAGVDQCVERSPEWLESCDHCFVREAPAGPEQRRSYMREQRKSTLQGLGLNLLLSGAAYALAEEKYRETIVWVTLGGSILPSFFYIRRYFAAVPDPEASQSGRHNDEPGIDGIRLGFDARPADGVGIQCRLALGF